MRSPAVYLALVALMLRALVPVGWMPSTAATSHAALMPCPMMDGMRSMAMPQPEPQHPAKHHPLPVHVGSICPFATPPQPVRALEPYRIELAPEHFVFFRPRISFVAAAWDHPPRAPPRAA
jgi:hypothetical protein